MFPSLCTTVTNNTHLIFDAVVGGLSAVAVMIAAALWWRSRRSAYNANTVNGGDAVAPDEQQRTKVAPAAVTGRNKPPSPVTTRTDNAGPDFSPDSSTCISLSLSLCSHFNRFSVGVPSSAMFFIDILKPMPLSASEPYDIGVLFCQSYVCVCCIYRRVGPGRHGGFGR